MIKFNKLPFKKDEVWITSDIHAYHKNMAKGSSSWKNGYRDFPNEQIMSETIFKTFHKHVKPNHCFISLGDLSFGGKENVKKTYFGLPYCDDMYFCQGNHDHHIKELREISEIFSIHLENMFYLQIEDMKLHLCHYPIFNWHEQDGGSYMLHGHLHGDGDEFIKPYHDKFRIMDTGIDVAYKMFGEYRPFNLLEIEQILKNKQPHNKRH